jgi:DNA (cytosine-5)-methyltransferase 1
MNNQPSETRSISAGKKLGETVPYLSVFSGGMGLDIGLERQGFMPVACNDIDPAAIATIRRNRPHVPLLGHSVEQITRASLEKVLGKDINQLPLIAGGPPCQAFSIMGRRRGLEDHNGEMIFEFMRLIADIKPCTFILENVRGLHNMPLVPQSNADGSLLKEIMSQFEKIGYRLDCFLVNSANYGAPQIRERLICIGNRYGLIAEFPEPQFSNRPEDALPPFRTLHDAIGGDFTDPDDTLMNFSARKLRYLAMVPPGGNWRSLPEEIQREAMGKQYYLKGGRSSSWRRLSWNFPSPTVHTMPNHATTSMCHPTELRALTVGECAAIQEFPSDWIFEGTAAEKYRQIGNAVPVRLGEVAGQVVMRLLKEIESTHADGSSAARAIPSRILHLRPHVRTRQWWKKGRAFAGDYGYSNVGDQQNQLW